MFPLNLYFHLAISLFPFNTFLIKSFPAKLLKPTRFLQLAAWNLQDLRAAASPFINISLPKDTAGTGSVAS